MESIDIIVGWSTALKISMALLALWLLGTLLRRYDRRLGIEWKTDVWHRMCTDPMALAVYFGMRFVGCCLLLGAVLK